MDTLHSVLRSIRGDTPRRDHLDVFREFLDHLDRAARPGSLFFPPPPGGGGGRPPGRGATGGGPLPTLSRSPPPGSP
jgi:hypothetical protein